MEALTLPQANPHFSLRHTLDGQEYTLTFEWSEREAAWYVDLQDATDLPIVGKTKVVADWPLFLAVNDSRKFAGVLLAMDTTGAGLDPTLTDFGTRVVLLYVPPEELP